MFSKSASFIDINFTFIVRNAVDVGGSATCEIMPSNKIMFKVPKYSRYKAVDFV